MTQSGSAGFKSAADLPEAARQQLGELLLSLADNKRLLGIRYSDWILGAPTVEAGIACSAMAQDEWGHARIMYSLLKDFGYDPDALEHERSTDEYHSSELLDRDVSSWPELLALNFLWDTALSVQVEMLVDSRFEPIHYKVRKLLDEERFHFDHGHGWSVRMLAAEGGRSALREAYAAAWNACLCGFGTEDDTVTATLADEGIVSGGPDQARARWLERVGDVAGKLEPDGAGAATRISLTEADWTNWSRERRRTAEGGPDEDTLARVRGDRNRALLAD